MVSAFVGVLALLVGLAVGWAVRGPARWCPRDGDTLRCPTCQPIRAVGAGTTGPTREIPVVPT